MKRIALILLGLIVATGAHAQYIPGGPISIEVPVTNNGPDGPAGGNVAMNFPPEMEQVTWTCAPGPGAQCTAGSGDVSDAVILPNGVSITYSIDAVIALGASGDIIIGYDVILTTPNANDPNAVNNTQMTSTTITIPQVMDLEMGTPVITAAASATMFFFDLWENAPANEDLGICDIAACPDDQRASLVNNVFNSCHLPGNGDGTGTGCKIAAVSEACTICAGGGRGATRFEYAQIDGCDPVWEYVGGTGYVCPNGGSFQVASN